MDYFILLSSISTINKYYTWYIRICQRAQGRLWTKGNGIYLENHHILPKSFNMGGGKDASNLVLLTAKEHYLVHMLLPKFISNATLKKKMDYALWYLSTRNIQQYAPTSRTYNLAKEQLVANIKLRNDSAATRAKKARPGKLNGMYGKTHSDEVKQASAQRAIENLKGKTYEQLYGEERAKILKKDKSEKIKNYLTNNPEVRLGKNNSNAKTYEFTDPHGTKHIISGTLKSFCKINKLAIGSVIDVVKGRKAEYKGWIVRYC